MKQKTRKTLANLLYWLACRVDWHDPHEFTTFRDAMSARTAELHSVRSTPIPEHCERCQRAIVVGYDVKRDVWLTVAGVGVEALCVECFDAVAQRKRVRYWFSHLGLVPWYDSERFAAVCQERP